MKVTELIRWLFTICVLMVGVASAEEFRLKILRVENGELIVNLTPIAQPTPDPEPDPQPDPTPIPDPGGDKLLPSDLEYMGAFGVPFHHQWAFSRGLAYDRTNNGLFIGGHYRTGAVGEVEIVTPARGDDPSGLPKGHLLQAPTVDLWAPMRYSQLQPGGDTYTQAEKNRFRLAALHVWRPPVGEPKLFASVYRFYNQEERSFDILLWSSLDTHDTSKAVGIGGLTQRAGVEYPGNRPTHAAKMNGVMCGVPEAWAGSALGMSHVIMVGRSRSSGSKGASAGPTAYFLEPDMLAPADEQPDTHQRYEAEVLPGMYFPMGSQEKDRHPISDHEQADGWTGAAIVTSPSTGRRALVYVSRKGLSKSWYGTVADRGNKGYQGWPWQARLAFFDLEQIAEVVKGERLPWEIAPYALAGLETPGEAVPDHPVIHPAADLPYGEVMYPINHMYPYAAQALTGMAYDPDGNRLWLIQRSVIPGNAPQPVIHEWRVR